MTTIGLVNYGAGNYASVYNALSSLDLSLVEISKAQDFSKASHIVLPGVGAFGSVMGLLKESAFIDPLKEEVIHRQKPYLGICVGMQILAETGTEFEESAGLGFIEGRVVKISVEQNYRLPHIGWNDLHFDSQHPLFQNISGDTSFYFVHSYQFATVHPHERLAWTEYSGEVTACIAKDNLIGVQFHPEKSQKNGLQLLRNFSKL